MPYPFLRLSRQQQDSLKPTDDLRLIELSVDKFIPETAADSSFVILSAEGRKVGFRFTTSEGTDFGFVYYGFSQAAHQRNIYNLYFETMETLGYRLRSSTIDANNGDIYYARLNWEGQDSSKLPLFADCSVATAIILALMASAKIQGVKKVIDSMEDSDWPSRTETISFERP